LKCIKTAHNSRLASLLSPAMAITGFSARNFGLNEFKLYKLSKPLAVFSLVFGILFVIVAPFIFVNLFGVKESFGAIFALGIMFIPAVVSSSAILFLNQRKLIKDNTRTV
jgi:cellulose synthase/poly-beta-1,6-N-acetylglucosamine synthase-like glycosyltransferase